MLVLGQAFPMSIPENVCISREAEAALYPFTDYFKGFEKVEVVRKLFGDRTDDVLKKLKVEFNGRRGYIGVSNTDGHLNISVEYMNNGDAVDIYLDVVHWLVHVKQFMEGRELFDFYNSYVDSSSEVEACRVSVEEAKRLGLSDRRICNYLRTERMTDEDLRRLAEILEIRPGRR
jgi:hypothetical protein